MQDTIAALDYAQPGFRMTYMQCMNWINTQCDGRELKAELVQFAHTVGQGAVADLVPIKRVGVEGKIAYCLNRGARLSPASQQRVINMIATWTPSDEDDETTVQFEDIDHTTAGRKIVMVVNCHSLLDNARARVSADKLTIKDLPDYVRTVVAERGDSKPAIVRELVKYYQERVEDALSSPVTRHWVKPLQVILSTLHLMISNRASVKAGARGAQARKMASTAAQRDRRGEKAAGKVQTRQDDNELGIKSVDPANVVGATAAVLYNTKSRHIELYVATVGVLSMQGKSITGWDSVVSMGKMVRKPEETLPHWSRASTVKRLFVLGNDIRGKSWAVSGKISKNHVILKVM